MRVQRWVLGCGLSLALAGCCWGRRLLPVGGASGGAVGPLRRDGYEGGGDHAGGCVYAGAFEEAGFG